MSGFLSVWKRETFWTTERAVRRWAVCQKGDGLIVTYHSNKEDAERALYDGPNPQRFYVAEVTE